MRLSPIIKDEKIIYSNSSIKLCKERKYAIELIPVKSYKKGLIFLVVKTVEDITNNLLKLAKVFSQQPMPQFIPMLPRILEPSRLVRNLTILQTNRPSNSSSA